MEKLIFKVISIHEPALMLFYLKRFFVQEK